jgi:hypothetical protein
MKNEEVIIGVLDQISKRLDSIEQRQIADKKEMMDRQAADKKEIIDRFSLMEKKFLALEEKQAADKREVIERISSFESNANVHFVSIENSIIHERNRLNEVYDERKQVEIKFSRAFVGLNSIFAGMIALVVSLFTKS